MIALAARVLQLLSHNRWPRARVVRYSEKRFRKAALRAFRSSRFYRDLYASEGLDEDSLSSCRPEDIPAITKDMVRDNFSSIATVSIDQRTVSEAFERGELLVRVGGMTVAHSSGSTGTPCNFLYSRNAITSVEANMARVSLAGRNPVTMNDFPVRALYMASVGSGYAATAIALSSIERYRAKVLLLNVRDPWRDRSAEIESFNPNWVAGYPSCVRLLADLQVKGDIDIHPKKIIVGGEPLTRETSQYLEQSMGGDVIDYYACTESMALGAGYPGHEGIYLFDDLNFFEVDAEQRLIITPLYNGAFPLVRYRLDDVVESFKEDSRNALPYTRVAKVAGRSEEMMWFRRKDGKWDFLHPLILDVLDAEGIKSYQFVQTSDSSFTLKAVLEGSLAREDLARYMRSQIDSFLARKELSGLSYSIELVSDLPLDPRTGKARLVLKAPGVPPHP